MFLVYPGILCEIESKLHGMALALFETGRVYHVYNRSNGWELMFTNEDNYEFFLEKFSKYMIPVIQPICYCLMPNHFHFLIRVREMQEIEAMLDDKLAENQLNDEVVRRFSNFFNSYSRAYNRQQGRKGSLFMQSFKRKPVGDEKYLLKLIHYIHTNPVSAGLCQFPEEWSNSSYRHLVFPGRNQIIELDSSLVIGLYGGLHNFIHMHNQEMNFEI